MLHGHVLCITQTLSCMRLCQYMRQQPKQRVASFGFDQYGCFCTDFQCCLCSAHCGGTFEYRSQMLHSNIRLESMTHDYVTLISCRTSKSSSSKKGLPQASARSVVSNGRPTHIPGVGIFGERSSVHWLAMTNDICLHSGMQVDHRFEQQIDSSYTYT